MNVYKLLQSTSKLQLSSLRSYAFKSDLKIKWVRPEKVSCIKPEKSGDLSQLPTVDPNEYMREYQNSDELKSADPMVQSLFQLGNNANVHTSNYHREKLVKEVQRHPFDYGSMESKLAKMTATIRCYQAHMEQFPRDKRIKVKLKELIDKRKKFLKYLRRWDYRRFEWMLEKLDLVYKPPPTQFHWITRKESLQKLTDKYGEELKEQRLKEFREQLEAQEIPFLEEAIKKMEFVRREQIDCDVPVTVTEERINELKKDLETLKAEKEAALANRKQVKDILY